MVEYAPRILAGRYEVGELIGRGGMAEVHIGHDTRLGRTVAVKILRSDLARDPSFQARFRREAQAAASLNHPAIVAVYDTGEDVVTEPTGAISHVPFIVMEYVEGHTVRDILRDGAAVPIEEAVEITAGVLSALEYSHQAGIVHRDIKPANVMLTPTGAVKVMDFGIARAMADASGAMTQTQAVIGTAQYLSPEQARGETVDSRSDLYSTGCLLFELLTGRPPFIGDSPVAVAYQHARETAQPPSVYAADVPANLDRITMKALAKDRDQRYSNAAEFRADLEAAMRGGHVTAPAVGAAVAGVAATQVMSAQPAYPTAALPQSVAPAPAPAPVWSSITPAADTATDVVEPVPPRRTWVLWTLIAVAVIAIVGIIALLAQGREEEAPTTVAMDSLVGMTEAAAQEYLEGEGLVFNPQREANEAPAGTVFDSDPAGPADVPLGQEVTVFISSGPGAITIPDVSGWNQAQARNALVEAGFDAANISVQTENSVDVAKDLTIRTDPAIETSVPPDQKIVIWLSNGLVELSDLTGKTQEEARAELLALGLVPLVEEEESDVEAGRVVRQDRSPGAVPQGSSVTIFVAIPRAPEQVSVPNVVEMSVSNAAAELGRVNLNMTQGQPENHPTIPKDRVIRMDPPAGTMVDVGTHVTVIVSLGPPTPTPDPTTDPPPPGDGGGGGGGGGD